MKGSHHFHGLAVGQVRWIGHVNGHRHAIGAYLQTDFEMVNGDCHDGWIEGLGCDGQGGVDVA